MRWYCSDGICVSDKKQEFRTKKYSSIDPVDDITAAAALSAEFLFFIAYASSVTAIPPHGVGTLSYSLISTDY